MQYSRSYRALYNLHTISIRVADTPTVHNSSTYYYYIFHIYIFKTTPYYYILCGKAHNILHAYLYDIILLYTCRYAAPGGGRRIPYYYLQVVLFLIFLFLFIHIRHSRSRAVFDGVIRDSYEMYHLKELGPCRDGACYNNIIPTRKAYIQRSVCQHH